MEMENVSFISIDRNKNVATVTIGSGYGGRDFTRAMTEQQIWNLRISAIKCGFLNWEFSESKESWGSPPIENWLNKDEIPQTCYVALYSLSSDELLVVVTYRRGFVNCRVPITIRVPAIAWYASDELASFSKISDGEKCTIDTSFKKAYVTTPDFDVLQLALT